MGVAKLVTSDLSIPSIACTERRGVATVKLTSLVLNVYICCSQGPRLEIIAMVTLVVGVVNPPGRDTYADLSLSLRSIIRGKEFPTNEVIKSCSSVNEVSSSIMSPLTINSCSKEAIKSAAENSTSRTGVDQRDERMGARRLLAISV